MKSKLARFLHIYLFIIVFIILKCPKAIPWENHRGDECATHIRGWMCLREKKQISRLFLITSSDDGDEDFNQRWAYGSWQVCDGELSRPEVHSSSSAQQGQNMFDCMLDNSSQTARFMSTRPLYITAVGSYLVVNSCKLRKSLLKWWSLQSNVKCVRPHHSLLYTVNLYVHKQELQSWVELVCAGDYDHSCKGAVAHDYSSN